MDESNVDLCDDISNADVTEIEKNNGDTESNIETFYIPDRNGANEFEVQNARQNDFNRPISAIAVEIPTKPIDSTHDIVLNSVGGNLEDQTTDYDELLTRLAMLKVPSGSNTSTKDIAVRYAESRSDGQSCSSVASSNSLSKSYLYSSVSVDGIEDIPDALTLTNYVLVPKYKPNGSGYCWPIDKLPLSGKVRFDEGHQWTTVGQPIGFGASGECSIGHTITQDHNDNGTIFCVKKLFQHQYNKEEILSMYLADKDQHEQKQAATSLNGSENIVQFYGATISKKDVCIFMELMKGGTVKELLQEFQDSGLPKYDYFTYLKDVLSGLAFLHGKGRAHNDVKSGNVLLDYSRLQAKLADFGNASAIYDNDNSKRKDIWSAGCFLLEMLGSFIDYNAILKLKHDCTQFGCTQQLKKHSDSDTNTILQMFFGTKSIDNTAISIAKQCEAILDNVDIVSK